MAQKPKQLTPNASPAHFWGAEMRARRVSRGMSLDDLGRLVHRDRSYLAKIERGERTASAEIARDCDRALGDDGTLIRLHALIVATDRSSGQASEEVVTAAGDVVPPRGHVDPTGSHVANLPLDVASAVGGLATTVGDPPTLDEGDEVSVPARTSDGRIIFVTLPRRLFLGAVGATAASAVVGPAPTPHRQTTLELPAAPEVHPVEHFEQMRRVLVDSDNLFGPERVIPTVTAQIDFIRHLRKSLRGQDQQALIAMQAKYAEFAGWLFQDHGDFDQADFWTLRALEWSHGAQDHELTVYILARRSQLAGDIGDASQAIDLGAAALGMAPPGTRLAAVAATYTAHGHALDGDLSGTRRAYDEATELLHKVDHDNPSPWGVWLDDSYVEVAKNRSLAALGEYSQAAEGYEAVITRLPAQYRRDRGVYLARAATAYAGAGDIDHAAELALQALAIGLETKSGRILTELDSLNRSLVGTKSVAMVQFRQAMSESLGQA
jgi:tetratricopeptide (TPR) repeat protein